MNRRFWVFTLAGLAMLLVAAVHMTPRRADERTILVSVPEMAGERDVRIVTNAALDEIRGRYSGPQHEYKADFGRRVILYHESARLFDPAYRREIESRIREIGHAANFTQVAPNPHPPLRNAKGETMQYWTDRVTAVISLPDMQTQLDANRIVAAISLARSGDDPRRVAADRAARTLLVSYPAAVAGAKNVEHAIACSGYTANSQPARLAASDAIPHGWTPLLPDDS